MVGEDCGFGVVSLHWVVVFVVEKVAGEICMEAVVIPGVYVHGSDGGKAGGGAYVEDSCLCVVEYVLHVMVAVYVGVVANEFFVMDVSDFFREVDESSYEINMNCVGWIGWICDDFYGFILSSLPMDRLAIYVLIGELKCFIGA